MEQRALDKFHMDVARRFAQESYCGRRKVGAVVVTNSGAQYVGMNGAPANFPNECELEDGSTSPLTIHAEMNCLLKMLAEGVSAKDSTVYVTLSPCENCLTMLYSAGVKRVLYMDEYRVAEHIEDFRNIGGMIIEKYEEEVDETLLGD